MTTPFTFTLPPELAAKEPPERRGIPRDGVRLMVSDRTTNSVEHTRFDRLGQFLRRGDLLVFNSSRTLPASLNGCDVSGTPCIEVRLAHHLPDDSWLALLLCQQGDLFACGLRRGMQINFGQRPSRNSFRLASADLHSAGQELTATVEERDSAIPRLWKLRFSQSGTELIDLLYRLGQPIRYEYVSAPWHLDYYQTVYAKEPGSAEMPSAGRAFTWKLLFELKRQGVEIAHILLHTGLSSYMDDELDAQHPASTEEYFISESAAQKINQTRSRGGRVIAVGTTVVRALESVANKTIRSQHGYTRLHIDANHRLKAVDGLLTGMHEPEASHLDLLTAFLPALEIQSAYQEAIQRGYLWHEFGDIHLII